MTYHILCIFCPCPIIVTKSNNACLKNARKLRVNDFAKMIKSNGMCTQYQDNAEQPTEAQVSGSHRGIRHEEHHRRLQHGGIPRWRDVKCQVGWQFLNSLPNVQRSSSGNMFVRHFCQSVVTSKHSVVRAALPAVWL